MPGALRPALRELRANAVVCALAGAAWAAVGIARGDDVSALLILVAVIVGFAPYKARREVRLIEREVRDEPGAAPSAGLSPAAPLTALVAGALGALTLVVAIPSAAYGGALLGVSSWLIMEVDRLRRWERRHDRTLLVAPRYRWRGTNGRALGRGWFDPANFVAS